MTDRTLVSLLVLAPAMVACGPKKVAIDPSDVVNVSVRPASGQRLFCPGDPFQVEVLATLNDGSECSNVDDKRICLGKDGQIIDPKLVRINGTAGQPGEDFVWVAPVDPLTTASTGLTLQAWLEGPSVSGAPAKSMVGEGQLTPVYQCQQERVFLAPGLPPGPGMQGLNGPNLTISVTSLSTPFYPDAALVKIETQGQRLFMISPSSDKPVRVVSQGQPGAQGAAGVPGEAGEQGEDAPRDAPACTVGGPGGDGQAGGAGGPGGDGGHGGDIVVQVDEAQGDRLLGRVLVASLGGAPGPGGPSGPGGQAGAGGRGGPTDPKNCPETAGPEGQAGPAGPPGPSGQPGRAGQVSSASGSRATLFAGELELIQGIEATPAQP